MTERYWISGVQLGILKVTGQKVRELVVEEIVDKQFIANVRTKEAQESFKKQIKNFECVEEVFR